MQKNTKLTSPEFKAWILEVEKGNVPLKIEYAGQPVYLATAYDITERKRIEAELKKQQAHISGERVKELEKEIEELKKAGGKQS